MKVYAAEGTGFCLVSSVFAGAFAFVHDSDRAVHVWMCEEGDVVVWEGVG